ncbi:MAG: radical SAM protein [Candidatus Kapabacteria bacterium]|nr:radical SAM protein [Candidatus Kapabacteria bacterium]
MKKRIYIIQPSYKSMDGKLIKRLPVFNFSNNLPIISATVPGSWEKRICNEYLDSIDFNDDASVVILCSTGYDIRHSHEIAKKFRDNGKIVILGVLMEQISKQVMMDVIDSSFTGYPNPMSMNELLEDVLNHRLKTEYNLGMNLDFEFDYSVFNNQKMWFYPVMAGVGCKYSCSYCCYPQFYQKKYRMRDIEYVINDLKNISKKCKIIGFLDANIYNNREYLIKLLQKIIDEKLNIQWGVQATIDIGDDIEVLSLLKRAGCKIIFFGIETIDQINMKQLNKHFNINNFPRQMKNIKEYGIYVGAFFMFGLDNDTNETFKNIERFIKKNEIDIPYLHLLIPMPGSGIYRQIESEGRIHKKYYDEFMNSNPLYSIPCSKLFFEPKKTKDYEIEQQYLKLFGKLCSWSEIIDRILTGKLANAFLMLYLNYDARRKFMAMKLNYNKIKELEAG